MLDNHLRKESFEELLLRVTKEDFIAYYNEHTKQQTKDFFNIGETNIRHFIKHYNIQKSASDISKSRKAAWESKPSSTKNIVGRMTKEITKSDLVEYYITHNHTFSETAAHFSLPEKHLLLLIKEYGCYKPKTVSSKISLKTKAERYGDSNYNNNEKARNTLLELYGVTNPSQLPDFVEKSKATWEKHGFDHPMHCAEIKAKQRDSTVKTLIENGFNNYKKVNSAPNEAFNQKLVESGFNLKLKTESSDDYTREFALDNYFYDFKVGNTLIEINPAATHNSTWSPFGEGKGVAKDYHSRKTETAVANGYRCIHVWDWDDVNKITSLLQDRETVYARNCKVSEVDTVTAKDFIERYHLQGFAKSRINLGLYYKDEIVSIMTFDKPRYNKNYEYELVRYCSSYNIIGGAKKLFKHFINEYSPSSVISYCDLSKFTGDTYDKLGFTFKSKTISKHWFNIKTGRHITDNLLRQQGFDRLFNTDFGKGTSNRELMLENGFVEIYDAGQATYIWN